jgi:hypothetical protein
MDYQELQRIKKMRNIITIAIAFLFLCYIFAAITIPWGWAIYSIMPISASIFLYYLIKVNAKIKEHQNNL